MKELKLLKLKNLKSFIINISYNIFIILIKSKTKSNSFV
jgi:hypothetical protein